jgi:thioredoxin 1
MSVQDLHSEDDLESALADRETAVLDFWAPWCPPCKEFAPVFEAASERHADMAFCRINTQEAEGLAAAFDVEHIPTLVVIRQRIMLASQPGYLSEDALDDLLKQVRELDMDALREEMQEAENPVEEAG